MHANLAYVVSENLIIGARFHGKQGMQEAIMCGDHPPQDWVWWRRVHKKLRPTWREWETCWRNLGHSQAMGIPIQQSMRLLQYHGPMRLRQSWGWVASLIAQGKSLGDAMAVVFHLPLAWVPLLQTASVQVSFLESITSYCEQQKISQNKTKKHLRYPLMMSVFIMMLGVVSTMRFIPYTPQTPSILPPWLPYVLWGLPLLGALFVWWHLQHRYTSFFRFLELSLKAGHTEHEAIYHYCGMVNDKAMQLIHKRLQAGVSFSDALKGVWPDAVVDVITLNSGRLGVVVGYIADMVEADQQEKTERWLAWTQAGLIIMMGAMVMWMAWTTLIPLYENLGQLSF